MEQPVLPALDSAPLVSPDEEPFAEYRHRGWWRRAAAPWTLWTYIGLEVLRVALLSVAAISLLYTAIASYQIVHSGIQLSFVWPLLAKMLAYPLYFSVPVSLLFAVTLVVGRMTSDLETEAMRCHGASHLQILAPVLLLSLAGAAATDHATGWFVPRLHYEKRNLQRYIVRQLENLGSGRNRTILLPGGGGSLLVGAYQGTRLWRVEVDLDRDLQSRFVPEVEGELPNRLPERVTITAKTGELEIAEDRRGVVIHLRGVVVLVPEHVGGSQGADDRYAHRFSITDTLSIPLSFQRKPPRIKDLEAPALAKRIAELEGLVASRPDDRVAGDRLTRAIGESSRRWAFTLSAITFPVVGFGLCFLLRRRNRLMPFFLGNLIVIGIFYPLMMVGSLLAEKGFLPRLSHALPNVILAIVGIALLRKVSRQ